MKITGLASRVRTLLASLAALLDRLSNASVESSE